MIRIENLRKSFGRLEVLKGVSLGIGEGEIVAVIGPSGSGKSTFLRCINNLEQPQSGRITFDEERYDFPGLNKRNVWKLRLNSAMVFQNYNLFHHRTVLQNVADPLIHVKKLEEVEANRIALKLLEKVGVAEKAAEYPRRLSGGQQQRVGIARAMSVKPKLLLFDEPTSSLDPERVKEVLRVIKGLAKEKQTMIIVSHEMPFVKAISDKVVFFDDGVIQEIGTVKDIFEAPQNERLKNFLEDINLENI